MEFTLPNDAEFTGDVVIGGDLTLDSASPVFTEGDGTGSPSEAINKSDAGTYARDFQVVGVARWTELFDAVEDYNLQRRDGAGVLLDAINYDVGTGLTTYPNDVLVDRGDAELSVGSGSGDPTLTLNKDDVGVARVSWENVGVRRWSITEQADEDLEIERFNGAAVLQDAVTVDQSAGGWTFPANLDVGGDLQLASDSPQLRVGNGAGGTTPSVWFDKGDAGNVAITFSNNSPNAGSSGEARIFYDANERLSLETFSGSWNTALSIDATSQDVDLAASLDLASASPIATIGDGTGTPELRLDKAAAGGAVIGFDDVGGKRWNIVFSSGEDLVIERWNASQVFQDQTSISQATGGWVFPTDATVPGTLFLTGFEVKRTKLEAGEQISSWVSNGFNRFQWKFHNDERFSLLTFDNAGGNEQSGLAFTENVAGVVDLDIVGALLVESDTGDATLDGDMNVTGALNMTGDILGSGIDIGAVAGEIGAVRTTETTVINGVQCGNETALGGNLLSGSGAPGAGIGNNGDMYFRTDGGALTVMYQKRSGTWTATAA